MKKNTHISLLIFRVSIAFTMLVYGITKLIHGITFIQNTLTEKGLPEFLGYGVFIGEILAPILIMIGYRTRLAGLVFAFNCLVAALLVQTEQIFKLNDYGGLAIGLLFIYIASGIALYYSGAGKLAVSTQNKWD